MKLDKLINERFKEKPADCVIDSHALMIRGGYIKYVGSGIFSVSPLLRRITQKIEQIIREEMDAVDGQEVLFPVVMPAALWQESGRLQTIGSELLRFHDRNDTPMVLGMTHEEAAVHLVREYGQSYAKYPFMLYQIQTKFRDEARPRGGLIRTREFTMKDAYSFHTTQEDLAEYYERCHRAYERIFARCGIPEVISVAADSGMMGGSISHEFMLLTPVGEDSLALCDHCDYRANVEAAATIFIEEDRQNVSAPPLHKVATPEMKTIAEVCDYLRLPVTQSCKAVVYQKNADDTFVFVFLRGDLEVNESKLRNFLRAEIHPAVITAESGIAAGFIGPVGLAAAMRPAEIMNNSAAMRSADILNGPAVMRSAEIMNNPAVMRPAEILNGPPAAGTVPAVILFDRSLKGAVDLCCGANETDYHYTSLVIERDYGAVEYHDLTKVWDGGICPQCGRPALKVARGIEVGNIFQLGTKYTHAMGMQYVDEAANLHEPVMGCYGIGVGRLAAAVCEARHDQYGPVWPSAIAPWQVHLCCLRADDEAVKAAADRLYQQLQAVGLEVIYDDRLVSAGIIFSDADLLGVPLRVIVSPRNLKADCCEIITRDKSESKKVKMGEAVSKIQEFLSIQRIEIIRD